MIVFYALGGGWGHFTRIKSFIEQKGIDSPIKVIVSNSAASTYFDQDELIIVPKSACNDSVKLQAFIGHIASSHDIKAWYIDTFPVGILGELNPDLFQSAEINFLARRLKWETYVPLIKTPLNFKHVFRFEPLEPLNVAYLDRYSESTYEIMLAYHKPGIEVIHPILEAGKPIWLVVHTSDPLELEVLIENAQDLAGIEKKDPEFVVLSDLKVELAGVQTFLSGENPQHWYGVAERIFTAAGFNTWYELSDYREKHICLPFPRKYDDQFWRCRQV